MQFVAHWPGKIAAGRVSDHLCSFSDLLPTLAELAGVECPKDIDGRLHPSRTPGREGHGAQAATARVPLLGIRQGGRRAPGSWKALRRGDKPWELYDLANDLSESKDVAATNAAVLAKMTAFAKAAHTPINPGTIYDEKIVAKDRNYLSK